MMNYYNKSDLKSLRGWTDSLIKRFLLEHDDTAINPHYKSGPLILLFSQKRVETAEAKKEFQEAFAKAQKRRAAAKKAAQTRMKRTEEYLENLKIAVPKMAWDELVRVACEHYNYRNIHGHGMFASPNSERQFLERICVNYLRHELTPYEEHLEKMRGAVGANERAPRDQVQGLACDW